MEPEPVSPPGDDTTDELATDSAGRGLFHGEMPMPTAAGRPGLRTRGRCLCLLLAAMIMASTFIGVPLAAALYLLTVGYVTEMVARSAASGS